MSLAPIDRARNLGGRKPDRAKDEAILQAARACFFERGFTAATIEEIASRAEVSKVTIYKRFHDKESLFEAVVGSAMAEMERACEEGDNTGMLAERLVRFGVILLRFLFHPSHVSLDRMLAVEFMHMPELARRFFEAGPARSRARLAAMLDDAAQRGEIVIDDPLLAAADLLSLWLGFLEKELKFGIVTELADAEIDRRVARGTELFLRMTQVAWPGT